MGSLAETQLTLLELLLSNKFPLEQWNTESLINLLSDESVSLKHYKIFLRLPLLFVHTKEPLQTLEMINLLKERAGW